MLRRIHTLASLFIVFCVSVLAGVILLYYYNQTDSAFNIAADTIITQQQLKPTIEWKTYSNLTHNYSISQPKNWEVEVSQDYTKFISPNFNWGETPDKKIESGYFIIVRVLPATSDSGYSGEVNGFFTKKEMKISNFPAEEFIIKNIDEAEDSAPAEIKFKTQSNLVLIDGWFASQDKKAFLEIFEQMAESFKII